MKEQISKLISSALESLGGVFAEGRTQVERTRDTKNGHFATNVALTLAKAAGQPPRKLAEQIVAALPASELVSRVEVAGPGFINFFVAPGAWQALAGEILAAGEQYGRGNVGGGTKVLIEFVSANPTGPLHVGHGRGAAYGSTLASVMAASGFEVAREYYINDAGRQADIFGVSVWLRYLLLRGIEVRVPAKAYPGDYISGIAESLALEHDAAFERDAATVTRGLPGADDPEAELDAYIARARELLGDDYRRMLDFALTAQLGEIRGTLDDFGVRFDRWYSERELVTSNAIRHALDELKARGHTYERDGALWLRTEALGDEKDRVLIRENGQHTYFAADVAYHLDKLERGHALLIDVWGADHHGYIARVKASIQALTGRGDAFEVALVQFVTLSAGRMGKRSGNFVTLRELIQDAGPDATRFFYLTRSNDQHLEFDVELAKSRSNENPVFYIQYAHARCASVLRQLDEKGFVHDAANGAANIARLSEEQEQALLVTLSRFPEVVESAALSRAPHQLPHYLRDVANDFHSWYNAHQFIIDDAPLRDARLNLMLATRQVLRNGLALVGVSAPEAM
ncbi:MAG: arginine--tRNA ligase [Xanthomonadaceae bacterium]|nr:arginine--tRNA ligase [Xanthomonadaceae bacterium]